MSAEGISKTSGLKVSSVETGSDICDALFLDDNRRVILAGTSVNGACLEAYTFGNWAATAGGTCRVEGKRQAQLVCNALGETTAAEALVFGHWSQKSWLVMGGSVLDSRNPDEAVAQLSLVPVSVEGGVVSFDYSSVVRLTGEELISASVQSTEGVALTRITALAFRKVSIPEWESPLVLLAVGLESGDCLLYDLCGDESFSLVDRCLTSVRMDSQGVNSLQFAASGELVSVGRSCNCPVKVWALRPTVTPQQVANGWQLVRKAELSSGIATLPSTTTSYALIHSEVTSLTLDPWNAVAHLSLENGAILSWDWRRQTVTEMAAHVGRVSGVVVCPSNSDLLVSSGADGSVRVTRWTVPFSTSNELFSTGVPLSGLVVDKQSDTLLAFCEAGVAWRIEDWH